MILDDKRINQEDIFKVPDGYFENFDERLKFIIEPDIISNKPSSKLLDIFKPWIGLAAAFLLIAMVFNFVTKDRVKDQYPSTEIDYSYIEMWADEWSGTYEIYELISDNSVDFDDFDLYPDSLIFKGITDENSIYLSHLDY